MLAEEERDHHKLGRKIAREEDWLRYGVTARRKRNLRRLARLADLRPGVEDAPAAGTLTSRGAGGDSGALVVEAEARQASADGDRARLQIRVHARRPLGIVGPNGAGKTTLLTC